MYIKPKLNWHFLIVNELIDFGFKIELVLADSLYGEASSFIRTLERYKLSWVLAIRSNHGVLMPSSQRIRANKWAKFERIFSNQTSEIRYIRASYFWQEKNQNILENNDGSSNYARKFNLCT